MREVVIVSAARTPIGKFGGTLKDVSAVELGATVIKEAVNRAGLKPEQIDEVIIPPVPSKQISNIYSSFMNNSASSFGSR